MPKKRFTYIRIYKEVYKDFFTVKCQENVEKFNNVIIGLKVKYGRLKMNKGNMVMCRNYVDTSKVKFGRNLRGIFQLFSCI